MLISVFEGREKKRKAQFHNLEAELLEEMELVFIRCLCLLPTHNFL